MHDILPLVQTRVCPPHVAQSKDASTSTVEQKSAGEPSSTATTHLKVLIEKSDARTDTFQCPSVMPVALPKPMLGTFTPLESLELMRRDVDRLRKSLQDGDAIDHVDVRKKTASASTSPPRLGLQDKERLRHAYHAVVAKVSL